MINKTLIATLSIMIATILIASLVVGVFAMSGSGENSNIQSIPPTPKTVNYVVQIITSDSTSSSGIVGQGLTDVAGTGSQSYTTVCTATTAPIGYYENVKIISSADNPPSLTLNLLYNGSKCLS
jgi:hypothetical protein